MKTLLVPVDFTSTSDNAVNFSVEWAKKYLYERIILLRSFYSSMYENMIMSADFSSVNEEYLNKKREDEKKILNDLCKDLAEKTGEGIRVQTAVSELPLVRSIIQVIKSENPEMILLGSDTTHANNEAFVAGNAIAIARISPVRVLIVPESYQYQPVEKALVPVDYKTVSSLNKINRLGTSPRWHDVELLVLNVDAMQRHLNPDEKFKEAENNLHDYLKNFKHEIYYEAEKNVIDGILNFKKIKEAQLMIALPGVHSFLYSLTHKSVSEALYRKCQLPVMILK
ncbi:MAG: universal stress protein [Bacteroidota bacterium]|nr:universal stress protein [Bacteroidota bacterium]